MRKRMAQLAHQSPGRSHVPGFVIGRRVDVTGSGGYRPMKSRDRETSVMDVPSQRVTELLVQWRTGDEAALQALIPLVYDQLRAAAHHYLRRERQPHTLQTEALVHEAYLRLLGGRPVATDN